MAYNPEYKMQSSQLAGWSMPEVNLPNVNGFIPPWAEWDFNEWENCTDNADNDVVVRVSSTSMVKLILHIYIHIYLNCMVA